MNSMAHALGAAGRYAEADRVASRHVEEALRFHVTFSVPTALVNLAWARLGLGSFTSAASLLDRSEREDTTSDSLLAGERNVIRAWIYLSRGQAARAVELVKATDLQTARSDIVGLAMATRAYAEACCGESTLAVETNATAAGLVYDVKGHVMLSCTRCVLALDKDAFQLTQSLNELAGAIAHTGCIDSMICAVRAFPPLRDAARAHPAMRQNLVTAAMRTGDPGLGTDGNVVHSKKIREPLSSREREVLQLAAEGFRNDEIGQRLFISPLTVKTHLQNIYEKLDVASRTEAAMKAREDGLLG